MLKNFEQVKKFLFDIDRPILRDIDLEYDEDGHRVYFGGLTKVKKLLELVNNPDEELNIIHVVGTAGKGSVCNWLRIYLNKAGYKVGVLTSPHVTTITEEISVDDLLISENEFVDYVNKIMIHIKWMRKHFKSGGPSIFEIIFVISLLYFRDMKCDYVVLEAGMGGKYDATNAISKSIISILTSISYDHFEMLGDINMITKDKSSIVEKSGLLLSNIKDESILKNIRYICKKYSAKNINLPEVFINNLDEKMGSGLNSNMLSNLSLALYAIKEIGIDVDYQAEDLKLFNLPCRYEIFSKEPTIILDGAHNMSKIENFFDLLNKNKIHKPTIVFSIFEDKEFVPIIEFVAKNAERIIFTSIEKRGRKSPDLHTMRDIASNYLDVSNIYLEENNLRAFVLAKKISDNSPIVVTGSFIHCAKIREIRWSEEKILILRKVI